MQIWENDNKIPQSREKWFEEQPVFYSMDLPWPHPSTKFDANALSVILLRIEQTDMGANINIKVVASAVSTQRLAIKRWLTEQKACLQITSSPVICQYKEALVWYLDNSFLMPIFYRVGSDLLINPRALICSARRRKILSDCSNRCSYPGRHLSDINRVF